MSPTRRAVVAGGFALAAGPAFAAPSATDVQPWNAYRERLEARLADAGGGAFEAADGRAALEATNQARAAAGVRPLAWHAGLAQSARAHAADLLARGYVEHLSPEGFDPSHRFWLLERRTVGSPSENIAYHRGGPSPPVEHLVAEWRKSPPHWRNMLGERHTHAGFGVVRKGSRAYLVGTYAAPLARLSSPLPFRIRDFDEARNAIKGWDDLPPTLRPRVGAPQGAGAGAAQGPPPWLMQLGLRRQIDKRSFELIGGPIFVMGT